MDYFVRTGSDYSEIIMELIKDGHTDYESFFQDLQDSNISFSMFDSDTGFPKVMNAGGSCWVDDSGDGYHIGYKFKRQDLDRPATYIGKFKIKFNTGGTLIVPIREDLKIHVLK